MKILLRKYEDERYVWKTAKYNENNFVVDDMPIYETQIVSIINDNRKNYVRCSSCGKMFQRNGIKFRKHQEASSSTEPCMSCNKLRVSEICSLGRKFIENEDGTYKERYERKVKLFCRFSSFTSFGLDSDQALVECNKRRCKYADMQEISDIFTRNPGLFDDIITVDSLLNHGYNNVVHNGGSEIIYLLDDTLSLYAFVNKLGIVDRFYVDGYNGSYNLWYSNKYEKLFTDNISDQYIEWDFGYNEEDRHVVKDIIKQLYK